ncbi:hypothetical protein LOZ36_005828 [Ophidiomyces ophidiicola]|nr:hypothetical protein LOZ36_005828 [Ophidiomyces ophidiicola]
MLSAAYIYLHPHYLIEGANKLLDGPTVKILYAADIDDTPTVIFNAIPKAVVTQFSSFLGDCFPSCDKVHVSRKGCDGKTYTTIFGGVKPAFVCIFQWMLSSCKNQTFQNIDRFEFAKYARLYEAAVLLGISRIENEMVFRMELLAKGQVPIQDVKIIYANFPKECLPRQIVIRSIGDALFERRLRRCALYKDFKLQCAEYDKDIYGYIQEKKAAIREEEMAKKRGGKKKQNSNEGKPGEDCGEAPQIIIKRVQAVTARKDHGGKPTYFRIGLEEFGISNQEYTAAKPTRT